MHPGYAEQRTHDYVRHGTTTLFTAPEIVFVVDRHRQTPKDDVEAGGFGGV